MIAALQTCAATPGGPRLLLEGPTNLPCLGFPQGPQKHILGAHGEGVPFGGTLVYPPPVCRGPLPERGFFPGAE